MAKIVMLIDTSKCIGCRGCQVACKQWHNLPADSTTFTGEYTNPPDVSGTTLTRVKFTEFEDMSARLQWFFYKKQCMHCNHAECQIHCSKGVEKTREGFVVFNDDCTVANLRNLKWNEASVPPVDPDNPTDQEKIDRYIELCPYDIPRHNGTRFVKCDFCFDRFGAKYTTYRDGKPTTACELTCPSGAIVTDTAANIKTLARARLNQVKKDYRKATLYGNRGRVVFLLTESASSYELPRDIPK
jgi:formate dehydrogenase iron-sulfur subunit